MKITNKNCVCSVFLISITIFLVSGPDEDAHEVFPTPSKWANNEEIRLFREYLRIPTVHPNIDYSKLFDTKKQFAENSFSFWLTFRTSRGLFGETSS